MQGFIRIAKDAPQAGRALATLAGTHDHVRFFGILDVALFRHTVGKARKTATGRQAQYLPQFFVGDGLHAAENGARRLPLFLAQGRLFPCFLSQAHIAQRLDITEQFGRGGEARGPALPFQKGARPHHMADGSQRPLREGQLRITAPDLLSGQRVAKLPLACEQDIHLVFLQAAQHAQVITRCAGMVGPVATSLPRGQQGTDGQAAGLHFLLQIRDRLQYLAHLLVTAAAVSLAVGTETAMLGDMQQHHGPFPGLQPSLQPLAAQLPRIALRASPFAQMERIGIPDAGHSQAVQQGTDTPHPLGPPRRRPALHAGRAPLYVQQLLGLGVFGNMEQPHPQGIGCLSLRGLPLQQALFACLKVFFQQGPAQRAHAYVQSEDNVVMYLHRNILDSI